MEKELLHYDIRFALDAAGLLDLLTFLGGTALRLCNGAHRFSEDVDVVCGREFDVAHFAGMEDCVERYIMTDQIVSLVDCTAYVRYRDIWDLHWL